MNAALSFTLITIEAAIGESVRRGWLRDVDVARIGMSYTWCVIGTGSALLAGVVIGLERQYRQHPAGSRTNALVSVGAALFVSLSPLLGDTNSPTRIASHVVSGIGFLGGGVILRHVNANPGMTVQSVSSEDETAGAASVVVAEVVATGAKDRLIFDVMSRLNIEPGVKSVKWEKAPSGDIHA